MGYQDDLTRRVGDALRWASTKFPHLTEYPDGRFFSDVRRLCFRTTALTNDEKAGILELQARLLRENDHMA